MWYKNTILNNLKSINKYDIFRNIKYILPLLLLKSSKIRCMMLYLINLPIPLITMVYFLYKKIKKEIKEYKEESVKENFNIKKYIYNKIYSLDTLYLILCLTTHLWFPTFINRQNENNKMKLPFSFVKWFTWKPLLEWNKVKLIDDNENPAVVIDNKINFNLAFPHGVIPYVQTIGIGKRYSDNFLYHLVAGIFFKIPIVSSILNNFGGMSAREITKGNVLDTITNENYNGKVCNLFIGGVADQDLTEPGVNGINLFNHKGFLKLFLEKGANLNVSYFFNYENMNSKLISLVVKIIFFFLPLSLQNKIKIFLYFLFPIPYRVPITGIFTNFLNVEKQENVSENDVDNLYNKLNSFVFDLVYKYKEYSFSKNIIIN